MRGRRSPPTHTHRRFIPIGTVLQIDHAEFPLPLIQRPERVEKLLLAMKSKVAELLGPGLALKAVELLTVNLDSVAMPVSQLSTARKMLSKSLRSKESGTAMSRMTIG